MLWSLLSVINTAVSTVVEKALINPPYTTCQAGGQSKRLYLVNIVETACLTLIPQVDTNMTNVAPYLLNVSIKTVFSQQLQKVFHACFCCPQVTVNIISCRFMPWNLGAFVRAHTTDNALYCIIQWILYSSSSQLLMVSVLLCLCQLWILYPLN